jgi:hypothetical protein
MTIKQYFDMYRGKFLEVKLKYNDLYIKVVFKLINADIIMDVPRYTYIDADIVPDGDEEKYLSEYLTVRQPRVSIGEYQIEDLRDGNRLPSRISPDTTYL